MNDSSAAAIPSAEAQLKALGAHIRATRKALGVSSTVTAEAAGLSRVTLHRIEKGEPSVAAGAWARVLGALGLKMTAQRAGHVEPDANTQRAGWVPVRIALADYPQLKQLAWQVHGTDVLTPVEALDIYERNARHFDESALSADERDLLTALRAAFGQRHV